MKEHKIFTFLLIFLLISGFAFTVYEFRIREFNKKTMLDDIFSEAIHKNALVYEKVNFNDIADFEWSQLLLIRSYMNPRQVFEDEGLRWQNMRTSIKYHDGITLIVFLYDNQIVAFRDHSREMGDFLADGNTHLIRYGYSLFDRKDANFRTQFGREDRLDLVHSLQN